MFQRLFSFVKDDKTSVADVIGSSDLFSMFYLPISQEAAEELRILEDWILNLQRNPLSFDGWTWVGKSAAYSAKSFYIIMRTRMPTIQTCKWLWSSKCTMKIKVFGWLLFFDRLNTKDMFVRRHWRLPEDDNLCVICAAQVYEDRLHLFIKCTFSFRVWNYLRIDWIGGDDL